MKQTTTSRFWTTPNGAPELIVLPKMKNHLLIFAAMFFAVISAYGQDVKELSGVSFSPPGLVWFIQVFPDGSVKATYGSLPQHQMQMKPGSIDFATLVEDSKGAMTDAKVEGGTQVAFMLQGESSHSSSYLVRDDFLRRAFPSTPSTWKRILPKIDKDMKPDGLHIEPISQEMEVILRQHPIFPKTKAEQDGAGQRR
jgi:hypothetical protein